MRPLRSLLVTAVAALLMPTPARAHPGSGIVVDAAGNVYFVVGGSNRIMRLTPDGRASVFLDEERVRLPHHLVLGPDEALYVASDYDGRVWRVDARGAVAEYFASNRAPRARGTPELFVGFGGDPFTMDAAGNIYALASAGGSSLVRVTPDGTVTPLAAGTPFGELHFSSMTVGPDGALYVTDAGRVWRVTQDSAVAIVARGSPLARATGIAVDGAGNVYVADYQAGRVVRFSGAGVPNTPRGIQRLRLDNPTGVALVGSDVYVLDNPFGGTTVWRVRGAEIRRLYSRRSPRFYARWLFVALPVLLIALLVERGFKRRARRVSG